MVSIVEEKDAIRELLARYCFLFDGGHFEEWLDLFTEDGAFDLGSRGRYQGRPALRAFLKIVPLVDGRPLMRHFVTNTIIKVAGDSATVASYVLVVRGGDAVAIGVAGRYEDTVVKIDGTWRFKERLVHFDLMTAV